MSDQAYNTYLLGRQVGWAKSLDELESVWEKGKKKGIVVDEWTEKAFQEKRSKLQLSIDNSKN